MWKSLFELLGVTDKSAGGVKAPARHWSEDYPPTLDRGQDKRAEQIFDPALKQYARAFRLGDPELGDPAAEAAWRAARRLANDHVLRRIASWPLSGRLALRGSRTLVAWFGDRAREPRDLDWVAPASWRHDGVEADALYKELMQLGAPTASGVDGLSVGGPLRGAAIWTYERAPGYRVVVPWQAAGLPPGEVQLDIVFEQPLRDEPVETTLTTELPGGPITLRCVSRQMSLAWKLLWLVTDWYPEGKDVYDAVLLAESTTMEDWMLEVACEGAETEKPTDHTGRVAWVLEGLPKAADETLQWATFAGEMDHRGTPVGDAAAWLSRLAARVAAGE